MSTYGSKAHCLVLRFNDRQTHRDPLKLMPSANPPGALRCVPCDCAGRGAVMTLLLMSSPLRPSERNGGTSEGERMETCQLASAKGGRQRECLIHADIASHLVAAKNTRHNTRTLAFLTIVLHSTTPQIATQQMKKRLQVRPDRNGMHDTILRQRVKRGFAVPLQFSFCNVARTSSWG